MRMLEIEVLTNEQKDNEYPFSVVEETQEPKDKKVKILIDVETIQYIGETYRENTCTINGIYLANESYESLKNRVLTLIGQGDNNEITKN